MISSGIRDLMHRPKGSVPGLDALRSLAILLVISGHLAEQYTRATGAVSFARFPLFYFGWTGVDLFFVLSGFLIGRQLWKELRDTGRIRVGRFLLRRGFRIWPLYFSFLLFLVLFLGKASAGPSAIVPDLFFVSNYFTGQVSGGWSLSTEEQFYLIVPFSILLMNRFVRLERQFLLPVTLLLILPVVRALSPADSLYTPIHTHCDGLAMGLVLAWASAIRPELLSPEAFATNGAAAGAAAVLGGGLRAFQKTLFAFSALALVFGGMTLWVIRDQSPLRRILSWHGFYVISRLSYGMYLNHFELLPRLVPLIARHGAPGGALGLAITYAANVLVSMAIAAVTFILIENPFLALREKWLEHA